MIQVGDYVKRSIYKQDLIFRVHKVCKDSSLAILRAQDIRLEVDSMLDELVKVEHDVRNQQGDRDTEIYEKLKEYCSLWNPSLDEDNGTHLPGKVLHIDGDIQYLRRSLVVYQKLNIPAIGIYQKEGSMSETIQYHLVRFHPDILVITGHDAHREHKNESNQLAQHRNSSHFLRCVQQARKIVPNNEEMIIFAGACQSNFESLLCAGSNFASSPNRTNIHAMDPLFVVASICLTPFSEVVPIREILSHTKSGLKGIGGIQCYGKQRICYPKIRDHHPPKKYLYSYGHENTYMD